MASFPVPQRLRAAGQPPGRQAFRAWLDELPRVIARASSEWDLEVGAPYEPGGQCAWVAPARDRDGIPYALKVGWRHAEAHGEAAALRLSGGNGTVNVIRCEESPTSTLLLLERCDPGNSLSATMPEPARDVVIADLLRRFWQIPTTDGQFPSLDALCGRWEAQLAMNEYPTLIDPGHIRAARGLLRSLPSDAADQVLLFTDLHGDNVLGAQRSPWLAIDPKPHIGDPAFDLVMHIGTSYSRMTSDPAALAARMAALTDVDASRVQLWLFARAVAERPGKPWLQKAITQLAP